MRQVNISTPEEVIKQLRLVLKDKKQYDEFANTETFMGNLNAFMKAVGDYGQKIVNEKNEALVARGLPVLDKEDIYSIYQDLVFDQAINHEMHTQIKLTVDELTAFEKIIDIYNAQPIDCKSYFTDDKQHDKVIQKMANVEAQKQLFNKKLNIKLETDRDKLIADVRTYQELVEQYKDVLEPEQKLAIETAINALKTRGIIEKIEKVEEIEKEFPEYSKQIKQEIKTKIDRYNTLRAKEVVNIVKASEVIELENTIIKEFEKTTEADKNDVDPELNSHYASTFINQFNEIFTDNERRKQLIESKEKIDNLEKHLKAYDKKHPPMDPVDANEDIEPAELKNKKEYIEPLKKRLVEISNEIKQALEEPLIRPRVMYEFDDKFSKNLDDVNRWSIMGMAEEFSIRERIANFYFEVANEIAEIKQYYCQTKGSNKIDLLTNVEQEIRNKADELRKPDNFSTIDNPWVPYQTINDQQWIHEKVEALKYKCTEHSGRFNRVLNAILSFFKKLSGDMSNVIHTKSEKAFEVVTSKRQREAAPDKEDALSKALKFAPPPPSKRRRLEPK